MQAAAWATGPTVTITFAAAALASWIAVTPMPLSGSNALRFELTDGWHIVVRPSGTEPKIKVYILTKGADAAERDANLEKYSAWVKTLA